MLLLDSRKKGDLKKIGVLVDKKIDITVHFLDEIEQCGWDNFHHGEQGLFFIQHIAQAQVLVGDDIFSRKAIAINQERYLASLIARIKTYIDRVQRKIVEGKSDLRFFQKYISRIMTDILLLNSDISFRAINKSSPKDLEKIFKKSNVFTLRTKKAFDKLINTKCDNSEIEIILSLVVHDFYNPLRSKGL